VAIGVLALVGGGLLLRGLTAEDAPAGVPAAGAVARVTTVAPTEREPAPVLAGATLSGGTFDLAEHRGRVVVVNVWASWCAPCVRETPALVRVAADTAAQGVQFVGINTRDEDNGISFARKWGVRYPNLADPDGEQLIRFRGTLPPSAVPSTLLIDRQGRIAVRILSEVKEDQLRELLKPLIAEKA